MAGCWTVGFAAAVVAVAWALPASTLQRILTIPEQLAGGDLNQRLNIWAAGAVSFVRSPFFGSGAGSFATVAGLAPADTAHNTALALAVEGGVVALGIATLVLVVAARAAWKTAGTLRIALMTALADGASTSLAATVHENRTTWVLIGMIVLAGRMATESTVDLREAFATTNSPGARRILPAAK